MKGTIFDIKKYAIHDGPGIRTTVFLKGCPLNCWWCHNPEGIKKEPERAPDFEGGFKLNPSPDKPDLIGQEVTDEDLFKEIIKDRIYYEESGGGVTFSGGEPLLQPDFLASMLAKCRKEDIHTALDTCGEVDFDTIANLAPKIDFFLYDIKLIDDGEHRKYTGASNEKILANLKKLSKRDSKINLRFPVIPGITDSSDNIEGIIDFVKDLGGICKINLLPYHNVKSKYEKLGKKYKLSQTESMEEDKLEEIKRKFESTEIETEIGG